MSEHSRVIFLFNSVTMSSACVTASSGPSPKTETIPRVDVLDTLWSLVRTAAAAGVAQLVEHQLAMLDVAGSNPVSRST